MAIITRAKTGKVERKKESFGEFKSRQRAKLGKRREASRARRKGEVKKAKRLEEEAKQLQKTTVTKMQVETLKQVSIMKTPDDEKLVLHKKEIKAPTVKGVPYKKEVDRPKVKKEPITQKESIKYGPRIETVEQEKSKAFKKLESKRKEIEDISSIRYFKKKKATVEYEKERIKFFEKYYPVKLDDKKILEGAIRAPVRVSTELPIGEAQKILEEGISSIRPSVGALAPIARKITGKTIKTPGERAQELVGAYEAKRALVAGQTITPQWEKEKKVFEKLKQEVQKAEAKGYGKDVFDVGTTVVGLPAFALGLKVAAKAPVIGKVAKLALTKPGQVALMGAYVGAEAIETGIGIAETKGAKSSEEFKSGLERLTGVGLRGVGFAPGAAIAKKVDIVSFKNLPSKFKNLIKTKKPAKIESTGERTWELKEEGAQIKEVLKLDRYGNVYTGYETTPLYKTGQRTLMGEIAKPKVALKTTFLEPGVKITKGVEVGKLEATGLKPVFKEGKIEKFTELVPGKQTKLQEFPELGVTKERFITIDSSTGQYVEILPGQVKIFDGVPHVQHKGKWRFASEFKGWVKTDMPITQWTKTQRLKLKPEITKYETAEQIKLKQYFPEQPKAKPAEKISEVLKIKETKITEKPKAEVPTEQKLKLVEETIQKMELTDLPTVKVETRFKPTELAPRRTTTIKEVKTTEIIKPTRRIKPIEKVAPVRIPSYKGLISPISKIKPEMKMPEITKPKYIPGLIDETLPKIEELEKQKMIQRLITQEQPPISNVIPGITPPRIRIPTPSTTFKPIIPPIPSGARVPPGYSRIQQKAQVRGWTTVNPIKQFGMKILEKEKTKSSVEDLFRQKADIYGIKQPTKKSVNIDKFI